MLMQMQMGLQWVRGFEDFVGIECLVCRWLVHSRASLNGSVNSEILRSRILAIASGGVLATTSTCPGGVTRCHRSHDKKMGAWITELLRYHVW